MQRPWFYVVFGFGVFALATHLLKQLFELRYLSLFIASSALFILLIACAGFSFVLGVLIWEFGKHLLRQIKDWLRAVFKVRGKRMAVLPSHLHLHLAC